MARKKKHAEHVNHERWLVSYADFITLLFAFFVVLYASSQVDHRKVGKLARAIETAFQELGMFQVSARTPPLDDSTGSTPTVQIPQIANYNSHPQSEQIKFSEEVRRALASSIKQGQISVRETPEGTVISLREMGFFASGSAVLLAGSQAVLIVIAKALAKSGYHVRVEGNTDSVPIHNEQFRSNWELSDGRAVAVLEALLSDGFPANRISAAGYAEYRPLALNDSEEGRAQNRRVDLVVLNRYAPPIFYSTPQQGLNKIAPPPPRVIEP
ncbi:MAG: flagellar motor protein MotB [Acidobacteriaceae bacterium]